MGKLLVCLLSLTGSLKFILDNYCESFQVNRWRLSGEICINISSVAALDVTSQCLPLVLWCVQCEHRIVNQTERFAQRRTSRTRSLAPISLENHLTG